MPAYTRSEAKDWARENFRGAGSVITPSYTSDLRSLNEKAIRHDVRRNIELGFWGALLVSEAGTTLAEMSRFMEIAVGEAAGRHHFCCRASWTRPRTSSTWPTTPPRSESTPCSSVIPTASIPPQPRTSRATGVPSARATTMETGGANLVHRYLWKFQAWLNGYNGGPLRQPAMKLSENQMRISAEGLDKAGVSAAHEPFADFFIGRNPD